jgi:hypothetical protein
MAIIYRLSFSFHSGGPRYSYRIDNKGEQKNIIAYRLNYRYGDNIYDIETRNQPGPTIRLQLDSSPVD